MKNKEKLLVLAPHTDDESLGCGGLIARTIEEGGEVFILVFATNYNTYNYDEFKNACQVLGVHTNNCLYASPIRPYIPLEFDQLEIKVIISEIEQFCNQIKPSVVVLPSVNSFHQDHEVVGKATIAALRPHGYMPKKVLVYEQPYYGNWTVSESFKPNYYIDITNQLNKKMKALACYKSQKVPFDMIEAMAKVRGSEAGVKHAEAYMLMREII